MIENSVNEYRQLWTSYLNKYKDMGLSLVFKKFYEMEPENALYLRLVYQDSKNISKLKKLIKQSRKKNTKLAGKYISILNHLKKELIVIQALKIKRPELLKKIVEKLNKEIDLTKYICENSDTFFHFDFEAMEKDMLKIIDYDSRLRFIMQDLDNDYYTIEEELENLIENKTENIFEKVSKPRILIPKNKQEESLILKF